MKKSELRKIIKEEIREILHEAKIYEDPKYLQPIDRKHIEYLADKDYGINEDTIEKFMKEQNISDINELIEDDMYAQVSKDKKKAKSIVMKAKYVINIMIDGKTKNYSNGRLFVSPNKSQWYLIQSFPV